MPATTRGILCLSGLDPTGGAGLQADIETVHALGAHAFGIVTTLTVQDTQDVRRCLPVAPEFLAGQIAVLAADCRIDAVKIGLLGGPEQVRVIAAAVAALRVPRVVDPVLRAGGGTALASDELIAALPELFAGAAVITPNAAEARRLVPTAATLDEAGAALVSMGAENVLVTGGDEPGARVVNVWHRRDHVPERFEWPRVPGAFHGAGCTLAAAIAALLAMDRPVRDALQEAQAFTHAALETAWRPGRGRLVPRRQAR